LAKSNWLDLSEKLFNLHEFYHSFFPFSRYFEYSSPNSSLMVFPNMEGTKF